MRPSEILGLRWLDVDLTQNVAMLPQTKNGEGRIVPLNQLAHAALRSVSRPAVGKRTNLIFQGVKPAQVSVAFDQVCRMEQLHDFRFHYLRHTPTTNHKLLVVQVIANG